MFRPAKASVVKAAKPCLKQDGKLSSKKPTQKLRFVEGFEAPPPQVLHTPPLLNPDLFNDLEQANFRQVWREVSSKKFVNAARTLQKFARKYMVTWIMVNERRTDLEEELDYVQEQLQLDLQRVEWEKEDLQQDAVLEVQAEFASNHSNHNNSPNSTPSSSSSGGGAVKNQLSLIHELQREIRAAKVENETLKQDAKTLKKTNKQLQYDLKEKAAPVAMSQHKLENLQNNYQKYKQNHDQYMPNIVKWQTTIATLQSQRDECNRQAYLYRDCVLQILEKVQEQYPKKRVLKPMKEILKDEFVAHHPIPDLDSILMESSHNSGGSSSNRRHNSKSPMNTSSRRTASPLKTTTSNNGITNNPLTPPLLKSDRNKIKTVSTDSKVRPKTKPSDLYHPSKMIDESCQSDEGALPQTIPALSQDSMPSLHSSSSLTQPSVMVMEESSILADESLLDMSESHQHRKGSSHGSSHSKKHHHHKDKKKEKKDKKHKDKKSPKKDKATVMELAAAPASISPQTATTT